MKKKLITFFCLFFFAISFSYASSTGVTLTPKQKIEQRKLLLKQQQEKKIRELKMKKESALKPSFSNGTFIVGKDIQP